MSGENLGISILQSISELTIWYIENNVFLNGQQLLNCWSSQSMKALDTSDFTAIGPCTLSTATEFQSLRSEKKGRVANENYIMVVMAYLSRWHFRSLKANVWGQQTSHVVAPTE